MASADQVEFAFQRWQAACDHVALENPTEYLPLSAEVNPTFVAQATGTPDWRDCIPFVLSLSGDHCAAFLLNLPENQDSEVQQAIRCLLKLPPSQF